MRWAVRLACMGEINNSSRIWWETMKARGHLEDLDVDRKELLNEFFKNRIIGYELIHLAEREDQRVAVVKTIMTILVT